MFPDRMEVRAHDWKPGPSIERRTTMDDYIGLDVSLKETAVSVRRQGKRVWRGKCPSDPRLLAEVIRKQAPLAKRVVFETGPLSRAQWCDDAHASMPTKHGGCLAKNATS